jgi:hypothetical protein
VRGAVQQLVREGYPVRSLDIDRDPEMAQRYGVQSVPTFVAVRADGHELDRTSGIQRAVDLARFYNTAVEKERLLSGFSVRTKSERSTRADDDINEIAARPRRDYKDRTEPIQSSPTNPKPWKTVVRIKVIGAHSTGFGSGTVIFSSPEESVILTCAHIFNVEGRRQYPASQFPRQIMIDLFDGKLNASRVHFLESVEGEAIDYDFARDVGLIRIRPGRVLPASRVVPVHWTPKSRMGVIAVGCSEGNDATVWETVINRSCIQNFLSGNPTYEAVECDVAPKQGRSGGGLYTQDGYIVGVCNFAEPHGNHGLYATPRSIYYLLDRNKLTTAYAPTTRPQANALADRPASQPRRGTPVSVARSQSPDNEEFAQVRPSTRANGVLIPAPDLLGIADPVVPIREIAPEAASRTSSRIAWHRAQTALSPDKTDFTHIADCSDSHREAHSDPARSENTKDLPESSGSDADLHDPLPRSISRSAGRPKWREVVGPPANSRNGFATK